MTQPATSAFPGTQPHQRQFPIPPGPYDERRDGGADPIEHCWNVQQGVGQRDYEDWRRAQPPGLSAEDRRDSAGWYAVSDGALALKSALDAAQAHAQQAKDKLDAAVKPKGVPRDDVAGQFALDRAWRRTNRRFDGIKDPAKLVAAGREWIKTMPKEDLPLVREEAIPYLEDRGVPTEWVDAELAQRMGAGDLRADTALKAKRVAALVHNHGALMRAFAKGVPAPQLVDPYSPGIVAEPYSNGEPHDPNAD